MIYLYVLHRIHVYYFSHALFVCVTRAAWSIHGCYIALMCVSSHSFMLRHIHICYIAFTCIIPNSFVHLFIHSFILHHIHMCSITFMCVPWHIRRETNLGAPLCFLWNITHLYVRHDLFLFEPWHSCVSHHVTSLYATSHPYVINCILVCGTAYSKKEQFQLPFAACETIDAFIRAAWSTQYICYIDSCVLHDIRALFVCVTRAAWFRYTCHITFMCFTWSTHVTTHSCVYVLHDIHVYYMCYMTFMCITWSHELFV